MGRAIVPGAGCSWAQWCSPTTFPCAQIVPKWKDWGYGEVLLRSTQGWGVSTGCAVMLPGSGMLQVKSMHLLRFDPWQFFKDHTEKIPP